MPSFTDPPLHDFPDRAHRHLLEHPQNLCELVQQAAPAAVAGLDFDRTRLLRRDLPLPDWRRSEADLLFEIPFQAAAAPTTLVSVLVEHQSKPDPAMPLRTLLYGTLHWHQQWRAWEDRHPHGQPLQLSPLLAIVFHTGQEPWKEYRTLADLIRPPREFRRFVPSWKPVFWNLKRQRPAALRTAAGEWLRTMAVVRVERSDPQTFERFYVEVARSLEPLAGRDKMRWHDLMDFLLAWGKFRRSKGEWPQLHAIAETSHVNVALREEIKIMSRAVEQTWEQWARTHYTTQGELRACRDILRRLLEKRFGPLPETLVQRIEACEDLERLQAGVDQVLSINSLDDLQLESGART